MNDSTNVSPKRRRRRIVLVVSIVLALAIGLGHTHLLRWVGDGLVHRDVAVKQGADVTIVGGDGARSWATEHLQLNDSSQLLMIRSRPSRVVAIGAERSDVDRMRDFFGEIGLDAGRITVLEPDLPSGESALGAIDRWLVAHPDRRLLVTSDEFQSRLLRHHVDQTLESGAASRVSVVPFTDRRYDAGNWWTSRLGARSVFANALLLTRTRLGFSRGQTPRYLSPAEYEAAFLQSLDLAAPTVAAPDAQVALP